MNITITLPVEQLRTTWKNLDASGLSVAILQMEQALLSNRSCCCDDAYELLVDLLIRYEEEVGRSHPADDRLPTLRQTLDCLQFFATSNIQLAA